MSGNIVKYSLNIADFSIDFEVDIDASISCTRSFKIPTVSDYIFSVAEVWLRCGEERYLICGKEEVYNLEGLLLSLLNTVSNPNSIRRLEDLIDQGGLSKWMRGYWSRIYAERATEQDEADYEVLIRACPDRYGYIAVYRYKGLPVIEVTGQASLEETPFVKAAIFNAGLLADEIGHVRESIRNAIQQRMSAH